MAKRSKTPIEAAAGTATIKPMKPKSQPNAERANSNHSG